MSDRVPLGSAESEVLEFKGRDALRRPESIARAVVAMLNSASGGQVWIGVTATDRRAVAVEAIADAEREKRRLQDVLVSRVEPSPSEPEARVDILKTATGDVLRIRVAGDASVGPYALLEGIRRAYVVRAHARTRALTRRELAARFREGGAGGDSDLERAAGALQEARDRASGGERPALWVCVQPVTTITLGIRRHRSALEAAMQCPPQSGNRLAGWTCMSSSSSPRRLQGRLEVGDPLSLVVHENGAIEAAVRSGEFLAAARDPSLLELEPCALVEYPVSLLRLAAYVYRTTATPAEVLVDFALFGARGWTLRRGTPSTTTYVMDRPMRFDDADDIVAGQPLRFTASRLLEHPDSCALAVVREMYAAFGSDDAIPAWFDQDTERFTLTG